MRVFLVASAIIEAAAGAALIAAPAWVASALLGAPLDAPAGLVVARLAGVALLSLGVACWSGSRDARSRAAFGIVAAMLLYNLAAVALLLSARFGAGLPGVGLVPTSALHAAMAVWCAACLRATWSREPRSDRRVDLQAPAPAAPSVGAEYRSKATDKGKIEDTGSRKERSAP